MKLIVFGCGQYLKKRIKYLKKYEIVAYADNNLSYIEFENKKIIDPYQIKNYEYDFICIMTGITTRLKIKNQLENMGYTKILCGIEELMELEGDTIRVVGCRKRREASIGIFLLDLEESGAGNVCFYYVSYLIQMGYNVIVSSPSDGKLRKKYEMVDATILITKEYSANNAIYWSYMDNVRFFIINTIWKLDVLKYIKDKKKSIYLWVHEGYDLLENNKEWINYIDEYKVNLSILAVSSLTKRAWNSVSNIPVSSIFEYAIPDEGKLVDKCKKEKIVFAIIGVVCNRKAQDVFVDAINLLNEDERNQCEFWIIGDDSNKFAMECKQRCSDNVTWLGWINHNDLMKKYADIDVIVCPSRDDPLPVVVTEGWMHSKITIVSNCTGSADYIQQDDNGYICEVDSAISLRDSMKYILENKDNLEEMKCKSRKIYEEHFSFQQYQDKIKKVFKLE